MTSTGQIQARRNTNSTEVERALKCLCQCSAIALWTMILSGVTVAEVLQHRLPLQQLTDTNTSLTQQLHSALSHLSDQPTRAALSQLEGLLSSQLIGLGGVNLHNVNSITGKTPLLSSLLQNTGSNCKIREPYPLSFNFGELMPAEPSANSTISYHFSVDCKRPAAYRIVILDANQQQLYGSYLPAAIVQADGTQSAAAVFITIDGKPMGREIRNSGINPSQHTLSAELRASPQVPVTPQQAGNISLGMESAALTLIEFGLLQ